MDADLLERCARAAHAAYRAEPHTKQHTPESCPCKGGHICESAGDASLVVELCDRCDKPVRNPPGCHACRPALRDWPDLTEAQREGYRAQVRPAVEVAQIHGDEIWAERAAAFAAADRYTVALAHIESLGLHVMGCYAHVEFEEDDIEPRCPPECPTATEGA